MEALAYQGILVTNCHTQIQGALKKSLSHEHAFLFAEPVYDEASETIDWYTEAAGKAQPLGELPLEVQDQVRARIQGLAAEISAEAEELRRSLDGQRSSRGNILALALQFPGVENIFLVGEQPVIICWGFANGTYGAQPQDLVRLGPASATPATPVVAAVQTAHGPAVEGEPASIQNKTDPEVVIVRHEWGWLSFIIRTLLLLLLLYLLAALLFGRSGCVMSGLFADTPLPGFNRDWGGCTPSHTKPVEPVTPAPVQPVQPTQPVTPPVVVPQPRAYVPDQSQALLLDAENKRETRLRAELDDIRRQLQQRAALCPTEPKTVPVTPVPVQPEETILPDEAPSLAELMPRSKEEVPVTPKETQPKPVPPTKQVPAKPTPETPPKPEPKETPKPPKKGEKMYIPQDAKKNNDLSFLEGCWTSESPLFDTVTNKPLEVTYCFDAKGRGTRAIESVSYGRCVGPVRAKFGSGEGDLHMDADSASCAKGGAFVGHLVECDGQGPGQTQCYGQELGGKRNKWDAIFRRK